jgi:hypothetical protein
MKRYYFKAILTLTTIIISCPFVSIAQIDNTSYRTILHSNQPPDSAANRDSGIAGSRPATAHAAAGPDSSKHVPAGPPVDTITHFWLHPYFGIGAGWGIGSFPLFSEWNKGLPDSSSDLVGNNSEVPTFTIKEATTAYNIFWPILVSFTPLTNETMSFSLESSFYFIFTNKKFIASLTNEADSISGLSINWEQSCAAYYFTLGMSYSHAIPEEYFRIDGVNKASIVLGLSFTPLIHITEKASFSATNTADSTIAALKADIYNKAFNGAGISWKTGISTIRRLSPHSGLEIDLVYIGRWFDYFHDGGNSIKWKNINKKSSSANKNISFLSSEFEINLLFLSGKSYKPPQ